MKKPFLTLFLLAGLLFGPAGGAGAIPVDFDVDGAGSQVSLSGTWVGGIAWSLDADLDSRIFSLGDGGIFAFDFFTLTVDPACWGLGGGIASVEATLAFEEPAEVEPVTGSGGGWWFTVFGALSGGKLTWDDSLPRTVVLASGDSFEVDYSDICAFGLGNSATVQAIVTAHAAASVPEPATLLLLGMGLVGLAGFGRRFKRA